MRYRIFGRSGLRVSELCLGTMTFGTEFGWGSDYKRSRQVFETFSNAGGNFIDTADFYTKGTSETFLGKLLKGKRNEFVLATKYTLTQNPKDPNASGNHRKHLVTAVEASLKRLQTDHIDLYWVHAWDHLTPCEEVMRGLDDLIRAGKILYIGISDTPAWIVSRCNTIAELRGWTPFVGIQLEYSLIERTIEPEYFPMAASLDLAVTAWSPLGMGFLTGKYTEKKTSQDSRFKKNPGWGEMYLTQRNMTILKEVQKVAGELGASCAQVALKWLMEKQAIPIVGASSAAQLKDSLGSLDLILDAEKMQRLNIASQTEAPFPHKFLDTEFVKKVMLGENFNNIVTHRRSVC